MNRSRRFRPVEAAATLLGVGVPIVGAMVVALVVAGLRIPAAAKAAVALTVLTGGLVIGGRIASRSIQRHHPPVAFTALDPAPALGAIADTAERLGPRNHVVFALTPAGGSGEALLSIRTDRRGMVSEQALQLPYRGHVGDPGDGLGACGVPLPVGWDVLDWRAGEFVLLSVPAEVVPRGVLGYALAACASLHEIEPTAEWELTFLV